MPRHGMLLLAAVCLLGPPAGADQTQVYRSTADVVPVFVTAADRSGRLITGLARDDFGILDNGKPQPITLFDDSPQPIRLIVLIDVSGSMVGNLALLRAACGELISHLGAGDLARAGTFGKDIALGPTFTRDAAELTAWLPDDIPGNAPTPLWQAIDRAMAEFRDATEGRRVVLVLSDGKDTGPLKFGQKGLSQIEIAERAEREDVMIYGVGVYNTIGAAQRMGARNPRDMLASTLPDPGLGTVALETGGGYVELRARDNLAETFARIADELHQQYLLGFAPPMRDGKVHRIEVRVTRDGVRPRARRTYQAPR